MSLFAVSRRQRIFVTVIQVTHTHTYIHNIFRILLSKGALRETNLKKRTLQPTSVWHEARLGSGSAVKMCCSIGNTRVYSLSEYTLAKDLDAIINESAVLFCGF